MLGWEEIYKPEVCEEMVGWEDELHMHYEATRLLSEVTKLLFVINKFPQGGWLKIWILSGQLSCLRALLSLGMCDINCSYLYDAGDFREMEPLCQHSIRLLKVIYQTPEIAVSFPFQGCALVNGGWCQYHQDWAGPAEAVTPTLSSPQIETHGDTTHVYTSSISGLSSSW